jgi:hypothetical protein
MSDPPTLAEIKDYGVDVFCWCNRCSHNGVVAIDVLIAHCGPGLPFPQVHGRLPSPDNDLVVGLRCL